MLHRWLQALVCAWVAVWVSGAAVLVDGSGSRLASSHVPIRPPVAVQESRSAPRDVPMPPSTQMPMLEVAPSPEARSAGLYAPEEFPADPPRRPANEAQDPLPLSPPGTYMHTAVRIKNKMYVYGGVASYEEGKYMNDMWLFDFGAGEYTQLQGNYVPPLPVQAALSSEDAATFAPQDVPVMPNLETAPRHENVKIEPLHPDANPPSPFLPRRRASRPLRVVALEHMWLKDADKPLATGAGNVEQTMKGDARPILSEPAKELTQERPHEEEEGVSIVHPLQTEEARHAAAEGAAFLQSEEHLSLHHRSRARFLSRTLRALRGGAGAEARSPRNQYPGDNAGTPYSQPRFHRDGAAAGNGASQAAQEQEEATESVSPGAAIPDSAAPDAHRAPRSKHDLWSYDFDTHQWEVVSVASSQPLAHSPWLTPHQLKDPVFKDPLPVLLPPTRRLHSSVVMKDRMIVFGGVSYNNLILGDLWIFDPAERTWIESSADGPGGSPILPREGHSAIVGSDGLSMYVFGGISYGFLPFNDLWKYSAVLNRWDRLSAGSSEHPDAPMQRWLHTAIHHPASDSMVVFGGVTAHYVPLNDVHVYNIKAGQWRNQPCSGTPPFPRMMHVAVQVKDMMLVSGGAANNLPLEDLFMLDLVNWRWKELIQTGGYPFARTGASAIVLSPAERAEEEGEMDDLSPDAKDPHLNWQADLSKLASRPIVGSFSNEGMDDHEESSGSIQGLDTIAFPPNAVVRSDGAEPATQRPLYRYRKHARNNFYFVLFGGAAATSAPTDETQVHREGEVQEQ